MDDIYNNFKHYAETCLSGTGINWNELSKCVNSKVKSFLEEHGLGDEYDKIRKSAEMNFTNEEEYFNGLTNQMVDAVANKEKIKKEDVMNEFRCYYFSNTPNP